MSTASNGASTWKSDIAFALLAALLLLALDLYAGFPQLANPAGDNDSLLQLVEVRDLLAGQGWFDLHQYRMGLEGGFVMHWSRLLDAPLALGMLALSALTGSAALGEQVVQVLWPLLQFWLALFSIMRAARAFAGEHAVLPAAVVGGAALYYLGIFSPGALDHHNVQLMLTLAGLALLLEAPRHRTAALFAGACATLALAIGMESAPYAGTLGAIVALLFLVSGGGERLIARDFGLGVTAVSALVFITTIPASAWGQAQCDTFSTVHFVVAALAGAGLAVIASWGAANATYGRRLVSLGLLAFVLVLVVMFLFPQCLAAPYAGLDPRLQQMWLGHIDEAQSIFQLVAADPARAVARFATPLVATVLMALRLGKGGWRRQDSLVGALLVVAFLVSAWEVRGSTFSIAFAVIPLCAWIAKWRQRAENSPSGGSVFRMAAAWLISVNAVWSSAAEAASSAFQIGAAVTDVGIDAPCNSKASFAALARMPDTTVLAISNLGSPILAFTGHRALAGPYHRNVAGNLLVFDALLGSATDAKAVVANHRVGIVALCRGNPETRLLATKAPDGFLAGLMHGSVPDWLEPVAETRGTPLELYRVRPAG
ncbi:MULTISPECIES: GtrA family protein [unclassified Mesorhizobium]|uniref:GtrA family protein n=1 Tax=unclassified Mesorhizobium TaxID=325217 RepID=UPI001127462E|nr:MULTISPECIES: GtrA family protein [unclassified Mesorhizobium]TPK55220.1 GtrA family protein [Mesorhizobium sp. B2-5-2]TPL27786.1 GtrA family protein [Mesorhizobium sp. B2-4-7]TPL31663.1 GtrA family protein [Mesorhizobium sp. B2-4-9]TPL41785.1 GtrA family protein [Mesorhizobium sp. B2-4-5]TPM77765.1 GtrA family protein [Mesorhizobium sp. B2-1-6]